MPRFLIVLPRGVLTSGSDEVLIVPLSFSLIDVKYRNETRGIVLELASEMSMPAEEKRISLAELYCADEVFTTGIMGEVNMCTIVAFEPNKISRDVVALPEVRAQLPFKFIAYNKLHPCHKSFHKYLKCGTNGGHHVVSPPLAFHAANAGIHH